MAVAEEQKKTNLVSKNLGGRCLLHCVLEIIMHQRPLETVVGVQGLVQRLCGHSRLGCLVRLCIGRFDCKENDGQIK